MALEGKIVVHYVTQQKRKRKGKKHDADTHDTPVSTYSTFEMGLLQVSPGVVQVTMPDGGRYVTPVKVDGLEDVHCPFDLFTPEDSEKTKLWIDGKLRISKPGLWAMTVTTLVRIFGAALP
eukprot:jgi/Chrzof1/12344/Cz06g31080.t1